MSQSKGVICLYKEGNVKGWEEGGGEGGSKRKGLEQAEIL